MENLNPEIRSSGEILESRKVAEKFLQLKIVKNCKKAFKEVLKFKIRRKKN